MITLLKRLFWDEAYFVQYARAAIFIGGAVVQQTDILPKWIGAALMATAVFLRAGDKNQ